VPDPLELAGELDDALRVASERARAYLEPLNDDPVQPSGADRVRSLFARPLPEDGDGALAAVRELAERAAPVATRSSGPRFFHFVIGGTTPAALAADWLTSAFDQNVGGWIASPLGTELELVALDWLKELFRLPPDWGGVLTTGATMANFVALAAARDWAGERQGVDVSAEGVRAMPQLPILTSGHIHVSSVKSLSLLGIGGDNIERFTRDAAGRLDVAAVEKRLDGLGGRPAIVIANAGEVNAGDFDPIGAMADLAERHGAWLHVDGAFGLFARLSPRTAHLVEGVERAHSAISDGHKWLNVPHDCGFAFVREAQRLARAFGETADYLPSEEDPHVNFGHLGPEGSRRARALVVWATLAAYGRAGYQTMVERHLDLAQRIGRIVDQADDLERLAHVQLNIVCFRYRPSGVPEEELDDLNSRLGEAVLEDGRVFVGITLHEGRVAFRPAIVNWRTREHDVDLLIDVVRTLGARLVAAAST
jgi:glutamate/tyrosine decarboxylase-like PLP-dependent enzyme